MQRTDINCFLGNWPFRKLYHSSLKNLQDVHAKNGITCGAVSSLNSIFYNDPMEAEEELYESLRGSPYKHILTVNPALPAAAQNIAEGVEKYHISGVRIYPGYHAFCLDDPCMKELHTVLAQFRLPLYVTVRVEDERLNYMITPRKISDGEVRALPDIMPDTRILLTGLMTHEAIQLKELLNGDPDIYAETSYFKAPTGCMEAALESIREDKLIFGSAYPLLCFKSALLQVEAAKIAEDVKDRILASNARNFLSRQC